METASRVPAEVSVDKTQTAALHENTETPITTTTNTIEHGPQTSAPVPTSTTATHATATTDATPAADAPGYLQQAREALVSLAGTAQNAMGIDTPASTLKSLADNTKIDASMPTSEATGAAPGERVGGVGALPGNASEEGVARLPAERTSVPSRELEGSFPGERTGGVGALPGGLNESGVALLPDERAAETKAETQANVEGSTNAVAHPRSESPDKTDLKTAAAHPVETAKKARRGSTSSSSSSSDEEGVEGAEGTTDATGKPRKVSLKAKLAGGAKVAAGKIKKNPEMVAEGQAMRGH